MSFSLLPPAFPTMAADIAQFVAAQNELRATAGTTASFGVPTAPAWPDGTAINPDTNGPFDATVVRTNAPYDLIDVTVLVIEKQGSPLRPQADPGWSASGLREGMDIILDVSDADYQATVANASMFRLLDQDYNIEEAKPFGVGNVIYRHLVYGAER